MSNQITRERVDQVLQGVSIDQILIIFEEARKTRVVFEQTIQQYIFSLEESRTVEEIKYYNSRLVELQRDTINLIEAFRGMLEKFRVAKTVDQEKIAVERTCRGGRKKAIEALLNNFRSEQVTQDTWKEGTPHQRLTQLDLSAEEEEKFKKEIDPFVDPLTKEKWIKYPIQIAGIPSAPCQYLDIDSLFKLIAQTEQSSVSSFEEFIYLLITESRSSHTTAASVSLRDFWGSGRQELTVNNFTVMESEYPERLNQLIKKIENDRAELQPATLKPGASRSPMA